MQIAVVEPEGERRLDEELAPVVARALGSPRRRR